MNEIIKYLWSIGVNQVAIEPTAFGVFLVFKWYEFKYTIQITNGMKLSDFQVVLDEERREKLKIYGEYLIAQGEFMLDQIK